MSAPSNRTVSGVSPFTVACVPTGMKAGVATMPCGVLISPQRAAPSVASRQKEKPTGIATGAPLAPASSRRRADIRTKPASLLRLFEIFQVGRRLVFPDRHEVAIETDEIIVLANAHMRVVLGANRFAPPDRLLRLHAPIVLHDRPRSRESMVDRGNLVVQQVRICLIEINLLLDDGLIVLVQRQAGAVEAARALHAACLYLENIVTAVAVCIDPFADRMAAEGGLQFLRPVTPVGINSP